MTDLSEKLFAERQIRKTKKQKTGFIELTQKIFWDSERSGTFKSRSLAVAALKRKRFVGLYLDRIHTNIDLLLMKAISSSYVEKR